MLVRAQVIHDPLALLAEYHISVKTPGRAGSKVSYPSHGLSSVFVYIGVIPDGEGYRPAALRKHDPANASDIEKWQGIGLAMPQFVHRSRADACEIVTAAEPEPLLNAGMEKAELLTKCLFVDRFHRIVSCGLLRQFFAVGKSPATNNPIAANTATVKFKVSGL